MKRGYFLGSLLAIPAIVIFLAAVPGCTKKEADKPKDSTATTDNGATKGGDGDKKTEVLTAKLDGTVKGKVVFDGTPPERPELPMKGHADAPKCHAGDDKDQKWIFGKDHGVANVIVYLEPPAGKTFAIDEKLVKATTADATIDQPHCVYEPHVVAMFASYRDADGKEHKTGQKLLVKNSGDLSHNTKIKDRKGQIFGQNLDPHTTKGVEVSTPIPYQGPKYPIDVDCDKHSWMNAKIVTFNSPYFAVTDKNGEFEIKNVPTGVALTVKMWHEVPGVVTEGARTFKSGDNTESLKISKAGK